ncbi:SDR family NAD(P)-dependent oxidoreductase [Gracilimonas mengyeensis]|uniref:3-oxoacyl-[acyl-carrier protein] reductase n=1 Tax=Gracilimonas mengyeensis TaxID=1302730 RepID=A0A521FI79_9BACT|nr:SDR family oxidoreductase [Gracilimonas mengyeensis]SMO95917.1 3-oxoacyl-[acyl-carrier protein] reductase [Gracilimonas mengyeensis]
MEKTVIVTGATKGLGLEISRQLLENEYQVVGIGRSEPEEFKSLQNEFGERFHFRSFDLAETDKIYELVKSLKKEFKYIYGLVNNAAVGLDGILATMHEKDIAKVIKLNIESPIILTKYISRAMLKRRTGRIVNVSSIISQTGYNGLSVYAASKASLIGFTKSLARELGKANITVNAVAPGFMETRMTEGLGGENLDRIVRRSALKRLINVEEVAGMVCYLLSENAKSITGTTITLDAGSTA